MNKYNGYKAIVYDALMFVYQHGSWDWDKNPDEVINSISSEQDIEKIIKKVEETGREGPAHSRKANVHVEELRSREQSQGHRYDAHR